MKNKQENSIFGNELFTYFLTRMWMELTIFEGVKGINKVTKSNEKRSFGEDLINFGQIGIGLLGTLVIGAVETVGGLPIELPIDTVRHALMRTKPTSKTK
jgi:hypothetical protein